MHIVTDIITIQPGAAYVSKCLEVHIAPWKNIHLLTKNRHIHSVDSSQEVIFSIF